ncbi:MULTISPECIES: hypothetical protein [Alphaproteobacteria]|uniref:hypothetical protein n=1 Tax=Alphaproteobacteria TaxID=28211 RepID=UPI003296D04B
MRHFLIITCLAALTCATAPVQVALAQADSPIVESEVEPSPEPSEETPGESTPSEEGGPKAEQNDKEQKESGVSLSLSDPLTIARFVVTPILLWVLKNLVSYSFRRMHIARTIYVDVEYQLLFLDKAVEGLTKWLSDLSQKPPVVPYLRLSPDRHYVYPSIQADILECMWGEEITAVRFFYRDMEQVERHAEKIAASAHAIYALPPASLLKGRTAKMRYDADFSREVEAIKKHLEALDMIKKFWVDAVGRSANQKEPSRGAASQLLYSPWVWHPIFTVVPAFLILLFVGALFFGPNLYSVGLEFLPWPVQLVLLCLLPLFLILAVGLSWLGAKSKADKRIFGVVTQRYVSRTSS